MRADRCGTARAGSARRWRRSRRRPQLRCTSGRRRRGPAAGQLRRRARRGRGHRVLHGGRHGAEQHRGGRGRGLGAGQRSGDRRPARSRDAGREAVLRRPAADRSRRRRRSRLGRQRGRQRELRREGHDQHLARRSGQPEGHGHGRRSRASRARTGRCRARGSRGWRSEPASLWAVGVDNRIYRIDPRSARIVAKIPVATRVSTLAAGAEGVWFLNWTDHNVTRIDPATNRVAERIPIKTGDSGIAVGGGAVWVTSPDDGLLWRIEPGPPPRVRPIDVGGELSFVSYGDGAAWTADYRGRRGHSRRRRTNAVTKRVRIEAVQSLAVGAGSAWVSVAGGTRGGHAAAGGLHRRRVRRRDARRADRVRSPAPGRRRRRHARAQGRDPLGPQGPWLPRGPACRRLPVLRRLDGADRQLRAAALRRERQRVRPRRAGRGGDRPVLLVLRPAADPDPQPRSGRPARAGQPVEHRPGPHAWIADRAGTGELDTYYPTGTRNYARVIGRADVEGVALALLAQRLRLARVYLLDPRRRRRAGPARRSVPPRGRAARRRDRWV